MQSLVELVGTAGVIFGLIQNGIISLIIKSIRHRKSSDTYSFFPYCANLASALCWLKYGFLIKDKMLIIANLISSCTNFIISTCFYLYSQKRLNLLYPVAIGFIFAGFGLGFNVLQSHYLQIQFLQYYCSFMSILAFGSPLSAMFTVFRTKSLSSMSFSLCCSNFIVGFLWTCYGYLKDDYSIYICNFFGAILCTIQLSLFALIPFLSRQKTLLKTQEEII